MKCLFLFIAVFVFRLADATSKNVKETVLRNFKESFPSAQQVEWSEGKGNFQVFFSQGEVKYRVRYDLEGNVTKVFRYYKADMLPPMILIKIREKFKGKTIFGITEQSDANDIHYEIMLEDTREWYHIDTDAHGSISSVTKFLKG